MLLMVDHYRGVGAHCSSSGVHALLKLLAFEQCCHATGCKLLQVSCKVYAVFP
jgi:hypothetical protein